MRRQGKKLARAAQLWAAGELCSASNAADDDAEFNTALAALGLQLDAADEPAPDDTFWLWPECVPLWAVWQRLQTQWRTAGMDGARTGLDYAGVTAWLRTAERWPAKDLPQALRCIQAMEFAALDAWAKKRAERNC